MVDVDPIEITVLVSLSQYPAMRVEIKRIYCKGMLFPLTLLEYA